ncbi:MAG TPA: hypothetical protein PLU80_21105, partial [Acidobacteriota bacterium]|nr:hypothetical protein [Acidobacteriota bacterium]
MRKYVASLLLLFSLLTVYMPLPAVTADQSGTTANVEVLMPGGLLERTNTVAYTANGRYGVIASAQARPGDTDPNSGQYAYAFDASTGAITDQYWLGPTPSRTVLHKLTSQVAIVHQSKEPETFGVGCISLIAIDGAGQFNQSPHLNSLLPEPIQIFL